MQPLVVAFTACLPLYAPPTLPQGKVASCMTPGWLQHCITIVIFLVVVQGFGDNVQLLVTFRYETFES